MISCTTTVNSSRSGFSAPCGSGSAPRSTARRSRWTSRCGTPLVSPCPPPRRSPRPTSRPRSACRGVPPGAPRGSGSAARCRPSGPASEIEAVIDLGFSGGPGFSAEGLVHTTSGVPLKGLHPRQTYAPLSILGPDGTAASPGDRIEFYVEAAANPEVSARQRLRADRHRRQAAVATPIYQLTRADLAVFNAEVWDLILDLEALDGLQRGAVPRRSRAAGRSCAR